MITEREVTCNGTTQRHSSSQTRVVLLGDHRRERGGRRGDELVAEQDHAEQLVGLREQRQREPRAARAALRLVLQPVAVGRHHRRLGDREEAGRSPAARSAPASACRGECRPSGRDRFDGDRLQQLRPMPAQAHDDAWRAPVIGGGALRARTCCRGSRGRADSVPPRIQFSAVRPRQP